MNTFGNKRRVDVAGARVNVHKNRDGAFIEDDVGGGDEGEWRRDDQIVFLHAGGDHAQVQAAGAGVDADGVTRADVRRARALERLDLWTDAENRRAEYSGDCVHLDLGKVGGGHGNVKFRHRLNSDRRGYSQVPAQDKGKGANHARRAAGDKSEK